MSLQTLCSSVSHSSVSFMHQTFRGISFPLYLRFSEPSFIEAPSPLLSANRDFSIVPVALAAVLLSSSEYSFINPMGEIRKRIETLGS